MQLPATVELTWDNKTSAIINVPSLASSFLSFHTGHNGSELFNGFD
jgi:hypothetical protein